MSGKLPISLKSKAVVHYHSRDDGTDDDAKEESGNDSGLGFSLEKLNLGPRKKLLVLGLGGVLVHRMHQRDRNTSVRSYRRPDGIAGNFQGIWSSAREWNINSGLSTITRGLKDKLLFVWDQKECTDSGFKSLEKKDKPIFLKELKKLWEDRTLPWRRGQYSSSNTLLIDDDPYKALLNPPNTAIFPESYKVDIENDTVLGSNGELRVFLDGLADAADVPSYVKEHRVGKPAITESDSNWDYYSKIIRRFR
ncbi:hypothetical protein Vadar_029611 [Vaccinium darrowii]|uniref:Uncharacterized protein n=1 Tax=Vaccinium darrowii TaxID=229202 RepID=A0ACB7YQE3_9ERIC|nr:hypothetical protein Vadar_029611 [Vaccinium darrowii]